MLDINMLRKQLPDVIARLATRPFAFPEKNSMRSKTNARPCRRRLKSCRL